MTPKRFEEDAPAEEAPPLDRPAPAGIILRRNLLVYGLGGLVVPFAGIKLIDVILTAIGLV